MSFMPLGKLRVLLVEDNPGDVELALEALKEARVRNEIHVVGDGVQALEFLRRQGRFGDAPRPDLILLDLNLPKMDGREVLRQIKAEVSLRSIPIVVLTTSQADEDVVKAYDLHVNCYITKPIDLSQFLNVVKAIEDFWLTIVKLPVRV
jgi:two-component system, chemotaxis family, response regulator Rcp1